MGDLTLKLGNQKERFRILGIGLTAVHITNRLWDYVLYPVVISQLGRVFGGIIMTILSMILCLVMLCLYDLTKKDWLGIETNKSIRELSSESWSGRIASWILKRGDPAALVFLSLMFDTFITTAYMRHGSRKYNGMNRRDWATFLSSGLISYLWWWLPAYALAYGGVSIWDFLSEQFMGLR